MCWSKATLREDRKQASFDSILRIASESGSGLNRQQLIKKVARDLQKMGNTAWHEDRMLTTMLLEKCLIRKGE